MSSALRATALAVAMLMPALVHADELPEGFVYLTDVAPHIRQDMRYAGTGNFTGAVVPGYNAAECILAEPAAQALSAVGDSLSAQGLGLKVLDCYRPEKAVRHFVNWVKGGDGFDPRHYPRVDRKALFREGYVARRSGHSSGYTLDLTLTDDKGVELDMGTPFDFFDALAHTKAKGISKSATERRHILVAAMARGGFDNYRREWWHFSFRDRPPRARSYDFDIVPRGG